MRERRCYVRWTTTESGGGTEVSTAGSTGYARVAVSNTTGNFPLSSNGVKSNATNVTFPTAGANWGTITSFGIFDAATGGNLLYFGNLTTARGISQGDTARFAAGDFTITFE